MTSLNFEIHTCREWCLDAIHRFLQGRLDRSAFRTVLQERWAEKREIVWAISYRTTIAKRRAEQEQSGSDEPTPARPCDPRRLPRLLDRLCKLCSEGKGEEPFRDSIKEALQAYRDFCIMTGEARHINCVPSVPVFERPLPAGGNYRYPCTVDDIRRQLARVPEYDLEGLQSIGLSHPQKEDREFFGFYYHRWYRLRTPLILLHSVADVCEYNLSVYSSGDIKRRYRVRLGYGMRIERRGHKAAACWSEEAIRRYILENTLIHEIGHHVHYQQRRLARFLRYLPERDMEQFAEDYAIRFNRRRMEEQSTRICRSFGVK